MTKRVLSQVEAEEMGILWIVHGVMLRDLVCSCEIRKTLNVEPLLHRIEISARMVEPRDQNVPGNNCEASPASYTQGKMAERSTKDQVAWLHLRPCLVSSRCGANRTIRNCWKPWGISSPRAAAPRPSWQKSGYENELMNAVILEYTILDIGVGASKFLGVQRIFAQIFPNLPKKLSCNFCRPFLWCDQARNQGRRSGGKAPHRKFFAPHGKMFWT